MSKVTLRKSKFVEKRAAVITGKGVEISRKFKIVLPYMKRRCAQSITKKLITFKHYSEESIPSS